MINKICIDCSNPMILDDTEYNFKGNEDNYWKCEHCGTSCIEEIRFNQIFKVHWFIGNDDNAKEYVEKYKIKRG